ncbi:MAG: competence protein ComEC [Microgenomates group bacterium Gr01-1014_16]|nr:MAG: competence protein ComEC [Microgenomates group bacterium Gr01-1014_16]
MYKILALAALTIWLAVFTLPDDKLHVVFCDVGQGDAILIYQKTTQLLIDGGPNNKVLGCLGRHVPFYDRRIEVVILTHPQADHMNGIIDVIQRYNVMQLVMGSEGNNTAGYKNLMFNVQSSMINVENVYSGDEIRLGKMVYSVVWPTSGFVLAHTKNKHLTLNPSPYQGEGNQKILGISSDGTDLNSFSIGGILSFGDFDVLLTGDADVQIEDEMIQAGRLKKVEVLKVPHHGSKMGMTEEWLRIISPELAVISVGKNSYGHPTKEAIDLLSSSGARVLRTDTDGEVEIVSDGKRWWVKR